MIRDLEAIRIVDIPSLTNSDELHQPRVQKILGLGHDVALPVETDSVNAASRLAAYARQMTSAYWKNGIKATQRRNVVYFYRKIEGN